MYKRFGRFRFLDFGISWLVIAVFLMFSVASLMLKLPLFVVILPAVCAVVRTLALVLRLCERFTISGTEIHTFSAWREQTIPLPDALTLILSPADLCPPFAVKTAVNHASHMLKGQYAVSVLRYTPAESVLKRLHQNGTTQYTSSMVQAAFDEHQFLYSFVTDADLLHKLLDGRNCCIVIPRTLMSQFPTIREGTALVIDGMA